MRLLANEKMPSDAVAVLRHDGHDVAWVRTDAPGSIDVEVLTRARNAAESTACRPARAALAARGGTDVR